MKWAIPKEYKQYTKKDMKANYWKFGWKPPTPEDDPVPEWPSMEEMLPPWIAFPDVPRMSPAWYDADRHEFILRFGQSWSLLEPEERDEITSAYPAPESWNGWYEALSDSWSVDEHCQPEE